MSRGCFPQGVEGAAVGGNGVELGLQRPHVLDQQGRLHPVLAGEVDHARQPPLQLLELPLVHVQGIVVTAQIADGVGDQAVGGRQQIPCGLERRMLVIQSRQRARHAPQDVGLLQRRQAVTDRLPKVLGLGEAFVLAFQGLELPGFQLQRGQLLELVREQGRAVVLACQGFLQRVGVRHGLLPGPIARPA